MKRKLDTKGHVLSYRMHRGETLELGSFTFVCTVVVVPARRHVNLISSYNRVALKLVQLMCRHSKLSAN